MGVIFGFRGSFYRRICRNGVGADFHAAQCNSFPSLPSGHSLHLEENYNDLSMILEKINYEEHRWMVCEDFKLLTMLFCWVSRQVTQNILASYVCETIEPETSIGPRLTGKFEVP
ncbi:hypothetical protein AVEN_110590-1 [Araneus ventricosus]|uniref:Uncharacterized protein n=1 Tax=Araneus ventricosus TaxID=182803 RepID=A0A4Y2JAU4_ARAVE|nr:hypothetical protein AVEN_110590-1 [Araneus ventricosus]